MTEDSVSSLISETIFGDSDNGSDNPGNGNYRGRVYQGMVGSGETTFDGYDFKGNPLQDLCLDFYMPDLSRESKIRPLPMRVSGIS